MTAKTTAQGGPVVAMIGCGEAARAFAAGWQEAGIAHSLKGFDILPERSIQPDRRSALEGADLVFCLVTADQAQTALAQAAPFLPEGALVLDGNSCAPATKQASAERVAAAGARYVDMAIMAPVHPRRHKTPILVAGPHADDACKALEALGMRVRVAGPQTGQAAAVKMIRSVMVKGLEALTAECALAARRAGVAEMVRESLDASWPGFDLAGRTAYNLERMITHGARRAAEMAEVAATLESLGLPAAMSRATAQWQARIGGTGAAAGSEDWLERADRVLAALAKAGHAS